MSSGEETGYPKELGSREPGDGMEDSNRNQTQNSGQFVQPTKTAIEHTEELKLKAKYPGLKTGGGAGSAMLQKRLHKGGQKYFDSGDYNMARAKLKNQKKPMNPSEKMLLQESIGDTIPTPENLPARKPSLVSKLASGTLTS